MDNFGILALFQVLIADMFGILSRFQVLIADNFGILSKFSGITKLYSLPRTQIYDLQQFTEN